MSGGHMYQSQAAQAKVFDYHYDPEFSDDHIVCDWDMLRMQLLHQWDRLSATDIDYAGPNRRKLAQLVARKYGISFPCIENYLRNFERTLPL